MSFKEEHSSETFRSLISISIEAFKSLQWLNGGAVVALLAYFGQVSTSATMAFSAKTPMALFIGGLAASCLAFFTSYLTQLALLNGNDDKKPFLCVRHEFWLCSTVIICIVSLALFSLGALTSLTLLATHTDP